MTVSAVRRDQRTWGLGALSRSPVVTMIARRLAIGVALVFVVTALSFVLVALTPGDPATQLLGPDATVEQYAELRATLGLDQPLFERYWQWLSAALTGDLGTSIFTSADVTSLISSRLPVTASLVVGSLVVSFVLGLLIGVVSAVRGGWLARALDGFVMLGFSVPGFWLGAVLASVFALRLGWLPATGYVPLVEAPADWVRSLILPVTALATFGVASVSKQTRDAMLEVMSSEYLRMARASGVAPWSLVLRHALRNASVRVATVLGILAVGLIGGTVTIESVFALPGMGGLIVEATTRGDFPVVQGVVVYFTVMVVLINLTIDLLYVWLNPKVRAS